MDSGFPLSAHVSLRPSAFNAKAGWGVLYICAYSSTGRAAVWIAAVQVRLLLGAPKAPVWTIHLGVWCVLLVAARVRGVPDDRPSVMPLGVMGAADTCVP